jgi:hypothetical protein
LPDFDISALFDALDAQRTSRGLSWAQVAHEFWEQSVVLNQRRGGGHPMSPSTITGMAKRGNTTCQHALIMLRWLGRSPESFIPGGGVRSAPLPPAGPDRRMRWNLHSLYEALDASRQGRKMTWHQVARALRCTPNQLTGLRRARYGINMRLATRNTQWLGRPAADFVYAAEW